MNRKVLITGGAGFLGFHLARYLAKQGWQVDILDSFRRAVQDPELHGLLQLPNVQLRSCDLTIPGSLDPLPDDYSLIFHLAAIIGVQHVLKQPYEVLQKNIHMLTSALDLARRQKLLSRFVFASTSEVYAGTLRSFSMPIPTPEDTPLTITPISEPRTSYMLSKIYGEALCHHSGLPVSVLRPHNVYGPRMGLSHVIPELLKSISARQDGEELPVSSPTHRRTFCYIDDAVDLMMRIACSDKCRGLTLNLGSCGPEISIQQLAELMADVVGRKLTLVARPDTPGSPVRRAPDMSLAKQLTDYRDTVDLKEGIGRTYAWYRDNIFSGKVVSAT